MVSLNRETFVTLSVVVALAAAFYLYKELKQTNQDVLNCKTYTQTLATQLVSLSQAPVDDTKKRRKVKEESVTVVDELSE